MAKAKGHLGIARGRPVTVGPGDSASFIPGVQGIASSLDDITLNGRRITAEVGAALEDGRIERTIEGASTLELDINDDHMVLTDSPLMAESFDCHLDGLGFRFVKASKSGLSEPLSLTLEDLEVARLRVPKGARKALRGKLTRAEFARRLVRELKPRIPFYSPQLHKTQPIGTAAAGRANASGKLARREPGLSANAKITVKGAPADATQIRNTERVLDTCASMKAPEKVMVAAVCTINAESEAMNLAGGDKDSVGLFQQRASQGWPASRDIERDTAAFVRAAMRVWRRNHGISVPALCQEVQGSGVPGSFTKTAEEARKTVDLYLGGTTARASAASQAGTTGKYAFERKKKESTWDCTGRLAEEVQWRRFLSSGIFYFLAETHMLGSKPRMLIAPGAPGVEDLSFDFDSGKPITEISVQARARAWGAPPGTAAEVEGCGPANGTFIVSKIEAPLRRRNSLCDITLNRPTDPLPEPAPKRKKNKQGKRQVRSSSSGSSSDFAHRVKQEIDRIDALHLPYLYGGGHTTPAPANGRFDCSSFVSRVLQAAGLDIPTMVSGAFARWGDPGRGEEVTIYANAAHVFMAVLVNGEWRFAGTSHENPHGGPGWHSSRSASGFAIRHPRGH